MSPFVVKYPKIMAIVREAHRRHNDDASIRAYIKKEMIAKIDELVDEAREIAAQYGVDNHRAELTRKSKNRAEAQLAANKEFVNV